MHSLDLSYSTIRGGLCLEKCNISYTYCFHSNIKCRVQFIRCELLDLIINKSYLASPISFPRFDYENYGVHLTECKIKKFAFNGNDCKLILRLDDSTVNLLDLSNSIFLLCPSIFNTNLSTGKNEIILPLKANYQQEQLLHTYKVHFLKRLLFKFWPTFIKIYKIDNIKKEINCKKYGLMYALEFQHRNFRELYNLTRDRAMYAEQGDYYYLMKTCAEKNTNNPFAYRLFSRSYRWVSLYGQNIKRPLICLVVIFITYTFLYAFIGNYMSDKSCYSHNIAGVSVCLINFFEHLKIPIMLSLGQMIIPFAKWADSLISYGLKLIGATKTLLTIIITAVLVLTLRWNFRKA